MNRFEIEIDDTLEDDRLAYFILCVKEGIKKGLNYDYTFKLRQIPIGDEL